MAIEIDGTGSITGISAGGLPDGTVDTDVLAANAVTEAKLGSDEQKGLAKAWVNFNGTGTVAIRSSFNVASVTDNGIGDYTISFTNSFSDTNYCVVMGGYNSNSGDGDWIAVGSNTASNYPAGITTGSVRINCYHSSGSVQDQQALYVAVFSN